MNHHPLYEHTQRAPWFLLLYGIGTLMLVVAWSVSVPEFLPIVFLVVGVAMLVVGTAFHYLSVVDQGDSLLVRFGPLALFRRTVRYDDIDKVERGHTQFLDGWGIHYSFRGGWVWNIWGCDCVVLYLREGMLRIGTDDAFGLANFLNGRVARRGKGTRSAGDNVNEGMHPPRHEGNRRHLRRN